jgi:hypothetical protein
MELARRHPYPLVGAALATAGLIAIAPAAPPALDLQQRVVQLTSSAVSDLGNLTGDLLNSAAVADPLTVLGEIPAALQTNFSDGLSDISLGVTALGAGDVPLGLNDFLTAPANLFVDPVENVFLGLADAVAGQSLAPSAFEFSSVTAPDLVQLTAIVNEQSQALMADPTLSNFLGSLDLLLYFVPKDLFIDSLGALAGTLDPGAVAAAIDPAALTSALVDIPTLLLSLIP